VAGKRPGVVHRISPIPVREFRNYGDLDDEDIGDIGMTRNGFDDAGGRIRPERVRGALTFEHASVLAQVPEQ
jgi:hypothetical protein